MNESIKILEEIIEYCKEHLPPYYKDEDLQAIENLIKSYRELEKENENLVKQYEYQGALMVNEYFSKDQVFKLFIPKSKIKEKIEELENIRWIDLAQEVEEEHHSLEYMRAYRAGKEKALQELMEDK